jgi:hypothetical protein
MLRDDTSGILRSMHMRGIAVITAVGLLTLPALAGATSQLAATNVRIGDHPAFVRVVVDFNGTLHAREVEAGGVAKRLATLRVNHPGVITWTSGGTGSGVRASVQPATQGLNVGMNYAPRKFKFLSYAVVTGSRLAIDLWKSAPPASATQTCPGLALHGVHVTRGVVTANGTDHGIFENQFDVLVRGAHGKILGRKHVVGAGAWSAKVTYKAVRRQAGTIEAVDFGAKDGAIECLAQRRVTLPAS